MIIIIVFPPLHPCSIVCPGYVVRRVADPAIGSCFATRISCSILPVYRVDTTVDSGKSLQGPTCYSLRSRAVSVKLTRSSPMSRYYVVREFTGSTTSQIIAQRVPRECVDGTQRRHLIATSHVCPLSRSLCGKDVWLEQAGESLKSHDTVVRENRPIRAFTEAQCEYLFPCWRMSATNKAFFIAARNSHAD